MQTQGNLYSGTVATQIFNVYL